MTHLLSAGRAQPHLEVVDRLGKSEGNSPLEVVLLTGGWSACQTLLSVLKKRK